MTTFRFDIFISSLIPVVVHLFYGHNLFRLFQAVSLFLTQVNMETVKVGAKDFTKIVVLGEGGYGKVILVRKIGGVDHGRLYALKEMKKTTNTKRMKYFLNERSVLECVRGKPFLATLHYSFETETNLNVVLEYASGGDMFTRMLLQGSFSEDHVKFYVGEVVLALQHLHQLKIVHGDIKPDNILIDSSGHVVLADFGLSEFVSCKKIEKCDLCGNTRYLAPEVIQCIQGKLLGYPVDWWALGVVTYEFLTGRSPFASFRDENSREDVLRRIQRNNPLYPSKMSFEARDFVKSLLNTDPNKRLGAHGVGEVKKHAFFKSLRWKDLAQKKVPAPFLPSLKSELDVSNFAKEFTNMALEEPTEDFPSVGPAIHVTESPNSSLLHTGMTSQQVSPCCRSHSMTTTNCTVSGWALTRVSQDAYSRGDEKAVEVEPAVCEYTDELHHVDHTGDNLNIVAAIPVSSKRRREKKRLVQNILPRAVFGCIKR